MTVTNIDGRPVEGLAIAALHAIAHAYDAKNVEQLTRSIAEAIAVFEYIMGCEHSQRSHANQEWANMYCPTCRDDIANER